MTTRAMRPFEGTMPLSEARAIIDAAIAPIERTERIRVQDANGRVLAHDVSADTDVPPFSRAAMDGYAVRAADTAGAIARVRGRASAWSGRRSPGKSRHARSDSENASRSPPGAPLPDGADAVVIVEDTETPNSQLPTSNGGTIRLFASVQPGQNIGRQGADISRGQTVLRAGTFLNAARAGALSALGLTSVEVYAKPRVAILSTGDEIVEPGVPLAPGQIYDINKVTLSAVVSDHGGIPVPYRTAVDTIEDLSNARGQLPRRRPAGLLRRKLGGPTRPDPRRDRGEGRRSSFTASR